MTVTSMRPASKIRRDYCRRGKTLLKRVQDRYVGQLSSSSPFPHRVQSFICSLHESKLPEAAQLFLQAVQYGPRNEEAQVN